MRFRKVVRGIGRSFRARPAGERNDTEHLLGSRANAERIARAIEGLRSGGGHELTVEELEDRLRAQGPAR